MDSNQAFPLVSILIPAYNQPVYLEKALLSALNQDYPNCEIIICDDSTTEDVKRLVEQYLVNYRNVKYYNNDGPLGGRGAANFQKCFDVCSGEYINYLMHDDLYMPNKISVMIKYLMNDARIKLVTSYRKLINAFDNPLPDMSITQPLFQNTTRVVGKDMGKFILINITNVIGEPTTALFRKADIVGKIVDFYGYQLKCLVDVGPWLKLLQRGDLIYIREPLSCFRVHSEQKTFDKGIEFIGAIEWYQLITLSYRDQQFLSDADYQVTIRKWIDSFEPLLKSVAVSLDNQDLYDEFLCCYNEAITKAKN
jgi:glycosyltransferase involved in cell wall biosynthesis